MPNMAAVNYTERNTFFDNLRRFSGSDQQKHRITYWCNKIKQCVTRRERILLMIQHFLQ